MNKIVYHSCNNGTLLYYGEGVYLGKRIPEFSIFKKYGIQFDCVLMENGQYAWSFLAKIADINAIDYDRKVMINLSDNIIPIDCTWVAYLDTVESKWIMRKYNKNFDVNDNRFLYTKIYIAPTKEQALLTYKKIKHENQHR